MSDFSSGAIVDDDLDFSAAQSRSKSREAVGAKAAAWGGKGLNIAIGISAVVMVAGIALWFMQLSGGMVQTGMRNLDSWGLYITSCSCSSWVCPLAALSSASIPNAFGIEGLRRTSRRVAIMERASACTVRGHRLCGGGPRPAGFAPVGAVRLFQPFIAAHVGHHRARHVSDSLHACTCGRYRRDEMRAKMSHTAIRVDLHHCSGGARWACTR